MAIASITAHCQGCINYHSSLLALMSYMPQWDYMHSNSIHYSQLSACICLLFFFFRYWWVFWGSCQLPCRTQPLHKHSWKLPVWLWCRIHEKWFFLCWLVASLKFLVKHPWQQLSLIHRYQWVLIWSYMWTTQHLHKHYRIILLSVWAWI